MFPFRLRWPIIALLLAGVSYLSRYYTIGGIEHLHLQPRESSVSQPTYATSQDADSSFWNWAAEQWNQPPDLAQSSTSSAAQPWTGRLTTEEKLAVWQDRPEQNNREAANPYSPRSDALPFASPIPLPADLANSAVLRSNFKMQLEPKPTRELAANPAERAIGQLSKGKSPATPPAPEANAARAVLSRRTIRIASFNLDKLGAEKLAKPHLFEALIRILSQYDVTALQEIESSRDHILPAIMEGLNRSGRKLDYLIGPRLGRVSKRQFAFIFDTERLETDRFQLYTVDDPQDLVSYEPLVAWFRCKDASQENAFTFSLVNLQLDRNLAERECEFFPNLIQAIQNDGRREDDWIVAGDIANCGSRIAGRDRTVRFALPPRTATDVTGTQAWAGMLFSARATTEFTGKSGAFDFLRKYNLSIEQALGLSGHLPIWAEFSVTEGKVSGTRDFR